MSSPYVKSQPPFEQASYREYQEQQLRSIEQALNSLIPRLVSAPLNPQEGQAYYDLTLHKNRTWDGTAWNNWW
jgi:hypothetical protein